VLLIFIPNQAQSYRIRQGVSDSGVSLFSLVDTKETITTAKAAAFLHSMSRLKKRSIYKHVRM
jgi:uncharacterized protein with beta-barrel porin domain